MVLYLVLCIGLAGAMAARWRPATAPPLATRPATKKPAARLEAAQPAAEPRARPSTQPRGLSTAEALVRQGVWREGGSAVRRPEKRSLFALRLMAASRPDPAAEGRRLGRGLDLSPSVAQHCLRVARPSRGERFRRRPLTGPSQRVGPRWRLLSKATSASQRRTFCE